MNVRCHTVTPLSGTSHQRNLVDIVRNDQAGLRDALDPLRIPAGRANVVQNGPSYEGPFRASTMTR